MRKTDNMLMMNNRSILLSIAIACAVVFVGDPVHSSGASGSANQAKQDGLKRYLVDLQKSVMCNYYPPKCPPPVTPQVIVTIDPAGAIQSCRLSRSSGNALHDLCALKALERVREFKPLPEGQATMDVEISFDYRMFSPAGAVRILEPKTTSEKEVKKGEIKAKGVPQKAKATKRNRSKGAPDW